MITSELILAVEPILKARYDCDKILYKVFRLGKGDIQYSPEMTHSVIIHKFNIENGKRKQVGQVSMFFGTRFNLHAKTLIIISRSRIMALQLFCNQFIRVQFLGAAPSFKQYSQALVCGEVL